MNRLAEMIRLIPKTLAASVPRLTEAELRQQRIKDNFCPICDNGRLLAPGQACRKCIRGNDGH